jgi:hypothetical protein
LQPPYPELNDLQSIIGKVGKYPVKIEAREWAAENTSICLRWPVKPKIYSSVAGEIELPQPVLELAGTTFLVSDSGRRLHEIIDDLTAREVDKGLSVDAIQAICRTINVKQDIS